jgi:hypothetical protein
MKSSFLIRSIQSEWLKAKRSSSSWFVWVGALFVPFIITLIQTFYPNRFGVSALNPFWVRLFERTWEMTAILLLPMGIVIACSLICQIEFRNNTWKQVYATPQHVSTVFFAKYFVVLLMFFKWLIIFTVAFLVSAYLPSFLNGRMIFTDEIIPMKYILENAISFYISALPIIALQYLLSMCFRNFMVPIGVGVALVICSMFLISWKYGYAFPFAYTSYKFFELSGMPRYTAGHSIEVLSFIAFFGISVVHYLLYISKKERG